MCKLVFGLTAISGSRGYFQLADAALRRKFYRPRLVVGSGQARLKPPRGGKAAEQKGTILLGFRAIRVAPRLLSRIPNHSGDPLCETSCDIRWRLGPILSVTINSRPERRGLDRQALNTEPRRNRLSSTGAAPLLLGCDVPDCSIADFIA